MPEEFEVPAEVLEEFDEAYDAARQSFSDINPTVGEAAELRAMLQKATDSSYQAFKLLAAHRIDDGNNVPVVMGAIEAKNLAKEIVFTVLERLLEKKEPSEIAGEVMASLYRQSVGPLNMLCWEKYQREQIEAELSGK